MPSFIQVDGSGHKVAGSMNQPAKLRPESATLMGFLLLPERPGRGTTNCILALK